MGKGSKPRSGFNQNYRDKYDQIDWKNTRHKKAHRTPIKEKSYPCPQCNDEGNEMLGEEEFGFLARHKHFKENHKLIGGVYFIKCRFCKGTTKLSFEDYRNLMGF